jgi:predicted dithiol-disulfide oxidoreductase (DUF899 family)
MKSKSSARPKVVSPEQWLAARRKLLREEKKFTKQQDRLNQRRRSLPWVKIEKPYAFQSPKGRVTLADLFAGRSQLIVQHFMLGPGWEEGCPSCSFMMDHFAPTVVHLGARDVSFAAVSRAPLAEIQRFRKRMGWGVNWVSSHGTDFNFDFNVSFDPKEAAAGKVLYNFTARHVPNPEEMPGISVFTKGADGSVYRTYSTYGRGVEIIMGTYPLLDLVPKGRDEDELDYGMEWVRYHDSYDHAAAGR